MLEFKLDPIKYRTVYYTPIDGMSCDGDVLGVYVVGLPLVEFCLPSLVRDGDSSRPLVIVGPPHF